MEESTKPRGKPGYLGLLNAISLGESRAGIYLDAWARVTPDPDLCEALTCVARRETNHGETFRRRILEFGFDVLEREDPGFQARLDCLSSTDMTDLEKVQALQSEEGEGGSDPFVDIEKQMEDGIFDPLTESMLRWYIGEERDSGKLLRDAYACVKEKAGAHEQGGNGAAPAGGGTLSPDARVLAEQVSDGFSRLEKVIGDLATAIRDSELVQRGKGARASAQKS
jgi:hypothetical protein